MKTTTKRTDNLDARNDSRRGPQQRPVEIQAEEQPRAGAERDRKLKQLSEWRAARVKLYGPKLADLLERAWAAGLFDGEGTVGRASRGDIFCELTQVEEDLANLVRFRDAVGVGRIGPTRDRSKGNLERPNQRPTRRWMVSSQKDLQTVLERIGPFLNPDKLNGDHLRPDGAGPSRKGLARARAALIERCLANDDPLPDNAISYEPKRKEAKP